MQIGHAFPILSACSSGLAVETLSARTLATVLQLSPGKILEAVVKGYAAEGRVLLATGTVSFSAICEGVSLTPGATVYLSVSQTEPEVIVRLLPEWLVRPDALMPTGAPDVPQRTSCDARERWATFAQQYLRTTAERVATMQEHVALVRTALVLQSIMRGMQRRFGALDSARQSSVFESLQADTEGILDDPAGTQRGESTHCSVSLPWNVNEHRQQAQVHLFKKVRDGAGAAERRIFSILVVVHSRTLGCVQTLLSGSDREGEISFQVEDAEFRDCILEHVPYLHTLITQWRISSIACQHVPAAQNVHDVKRAIATLFAAHPLDVRI